MVKMRYWICIILLYLFSGCQKEESPLDCIGEYLAQAEMEVYKGEELGCRFFLHLYEYSEKQYFVLDNYCVDMVTYPTDCEGNRLCDGEGEKICSDFFAQAVYVGIVGFAP